MIYENVEEYYEDGTLKCKYILRFEEKHGLYQAWFKSGQKCVEFTYINGKRDGLYQSWWKNEQKCVEFTYKDGKKRRIISTLE